MNICISTAIVSVVLCLFLNWSWIGAFIWLFTFDKEYKLKTFIGGPYLWVIKLLEKIIY